MYWPQTTLVAQASMPYAVCDTNCRTDQLQSALVCIHPLQVSMREKIQALLNHLNHGLVEREATIKAALLTVLAGENIVLIGPPGTGKSLIARRIAESLGSPQQGGYFEYLLTKFSTPEEIFGPLSISALKQDVFKRNTAGYLPSVRVGFLDEIFKASSSILNALLTILNERKFHNGAQAEDVPLQALIAASNELPTGQEELAALYDRFLVRGFVDYVGPDGLGQMLGASVVQHQTLPERLRITSADMKKLREKAKAVTVPPAIGQALLEIWSAHKNAFRDDAREQLSDRRLMKCLNLMRVSAATNGRDEVDLSDVMLLKDCLWHHPDNLQKINKLMMKVLSSYEGVSGEFEIKMGKEFDGLWEVVRVKEESERMINDEDYIIEIARNKRGAKFGVMSSKPGLLKEIKVKVGDVLSSGAVVAVVEERVDILSGLLKSNIWL